MITGAHVLFYSAKPEADREFFREILGFRAVNAGGGWLIFALPPAEAAFHPTDGTARQSDKVLSAEIFLMCDDLQAEITRLQEKKIHCAPVEAARWGIKTSMRLPSGGELGIYQPTHPTAIELRSK